MKRFTSIFTLIMMAGHMAGGAVKSIQLPPETATFKPGKGSEVTSSYCITCHSVEYVTSQPPLPRKAWEATVMKMKEKFGAPIPDSSVQEIADYLTDAYGKK